MEKFKYSFRDFLIEKYIGKRKYSSNPMIRIQHVSPTRFNVLSFINKKGKVTREDLNDFFEGLNKKTGKHTSMRWIYKNKKLIKRKKTKDGVFYYLSPYGKHVLKITSVRESLELLEKGVEFLIEIEDTATLSNTPGMGNSQMPSFDSFGSGDSFGGSLDKEEFDCDEDDEFYEECLEEKEQSSNEIWFTVKKEKEHEISRKIEKEIPNAKIKTTFVVLGNENKIGFLVIIKPEDKKKIQEFIKKYNLQNLEL
jgi:hypothetical protein